MKRKRRSRKKKSLEREDTLRRFKDAVKNLNQIARKELQIGGVGGGDGPSPGDPREMRAPVDGFEFIPDIYRIVVAERDVLRLRIQVDGSTGIAVGERIEVSCDNPHIKILDDRPLVPKLVSEQPPLSIVRIAVEGLQANAEGFVTAKCGTKMAIAAVQVVSTKTQKEHHPSGGLYVKIFVTRRSRNCQYALVSRKKRA